MSSNPKIIMIIIIIILYKIYIVPYIICKETALRHFTNIIINKKKLHEHSIHIYNIIPLLWPPLGLRKVIVIGEWLYCRNISWTQKQESANNCLLFLVFLYSFMKLPLSAKTSSFWFSFVLPEMVTRNSTLSWCCSMCRWPLSQAEWH